MNIKRLKINDVQRTLHFEKLLCYFIIKLINYYLLLFDIVLLFFFLFFQIVNLCNANIYNALQI